MYLRSRTLKFPNSRDKATDTVSDGSIYLSMVQLSALWLLPHRVSELVSWVQSSLSPAPSLIDDMQRRRNVMPIVHNNEVNRNLPIFGRSIGDQGVCID